MKYVLLTHNAENLGDVAILEATLQHIHEIDPSPQIVLETNNVEVSQKYFPAIEIVGRLFPTKNIKHARKTFSLSFVINNFSFLLQVVFRTLNAIIFSLGIYKRSQIDILNHIKEANIVLSIAGDSLAPQYAWYLRFFELWTIHRLQTPIVLYAQSIGPFSGYQIGLAKKYLSLATLILTRDQRTYDLLHKYGVTTQIEQTADTVISLKPRENETTNRALQRYKISDRTVGIVIRTNLYSGIPHKEYERYLCGMAQVVRHLIEQKYQPLFISTTGEDTDAAKKFSKRFGFTLQVYDLREHLPSEVKTILSKFALVISPRMHPIILSSTMGTPVIGLGKEFKMLNYLQLAGISKQHLPMIPLDVAKIISLLNNSLAHRKEISEKLSKYLINSTQKSTTNMHHLKAFLSKQHESKENESGF